MGEAIKFMFRNGLSEIHKDSTPNQTLHTNQQECDWYDEIIDDDLKWSFALNSVLHQGTSEYQDIALLDTKRFGKDYNEHGQLSFSEFSDLITAFGNFVAANKKEELFKAADLNGDGVVTIDELAALLALQQEQEPIINNCPACGEALQLSYKLNVMIHMTLC